MYSVQTVRITAITAIYGENNLSCKPIMILCSTVYFTAYD